MMMRIALGFVYGFVSSAIFDILGLSPEQWMWWAFAIPFTIVFAIIASILLRQSAL
jgi:uncharacterized membrane protein